MANFLLKDCEGYDVEIVSAAFNGTGFRPKVVQFEDFVIAGVYFIQRLGNLALWAIA